MNRTIFSVWNEETLFSALRRNAFFLHFQPKVDLFTSRICGAEALVRYVEQDGTVVSPSEFIPILENQGLIGILTQWICRQSIAFLEYILPHAPQDFRLSFNVSAYNLRHIQFLEELKKALTGREYLSLHLILELTEDGLGNIEQPIVDELIELRDRGLGLSMDDFGTAYSGIERLSKLPFTELKIDRYFISQIGKSDTASRIIDASVAMSHYLGLTTVAEGIENQEQVDLLRNIGCEYGQGYFYASPLTTNEFFRLIETSFNNKNIPLGFISQAILNHVRWHRNYVCNLHRLHNAIKENKPPRLDFPLSELDHEECRLGRWIIEHRSELESTSLFTVIDAPHRELHFFADELWRAVVKGKDESCIFDQLKNLSQLSQQLVTALYEVEHRIFASQFMTLESATSRSS